MLKHTILLLIAPKGIEITSGGENVTSKQSFNRTKRNWNLIPQLLLHLMEQLLIAPKGIEIEMAGNVWSGKFGF